MCLVHWQLINLILALVKEVIMILSMLVVLPLALTTCQVVPADRMPVQEPITSLVSYHVDAMPITINRAVADNGATGAWLTYSVTNKSQERIESIEWLVFIVDGRGKLIGIEESSSSDPVDAGVTQEDRALIRKSIKQNGLSIVAVTKAVGQSGVWTVDLPELKRVVANKIRGRGDAAIKVAFDEHVQVSGTDRAEIFKLVLNDFLNDKGKADRVEGIKDGTNLLVLSDNVEFDLPQIPNVNLFKLNDEEIQKLADERGRVFYLIYQPFVVEGTRVMARLSLRDQRARRPGAAIPYKFTYLFICATKDGKWTIERSLGYAQS